MAKREYTESTAKNIAILKAKTSLLEWIGDRIDYVTRDMKNNREFLEEQEKLPEEERDWNYEYRAKDNDINREQLELLSNLIEYICK